MYPRFLLETNLSDSARLVYLLLLDRARMSMMNPGWEDENGRVFVFYPIEDLAADTHRSQTVVKKALADLQRQGLIRRCRQSWARPTSSLSASRTDSRKTDHLTDGIPTIRQAEFRPEIRTIRIRTIQSKEAMIMKGRTAYDPSIGSLD